MKGDKKMQTLIMMDVKNGKKIRYQLKDIKEIVTDKAKNFFNKNDLENNNIKMANTLKKESRQVLKQ